MKTITMLIAAASFCSSTSFSQFAPRQNWTSVTNMHEAYLTEFTQSKGFGVGRAGYIHLPDNLQVPIAGQRFIVRGAELIGWVNNPSPRVYLTAEGTPLNSIFTNRMLRAKIPTRHLTALETNALAELMAGKDLIVQAAPQAPTVVGAMRAHEQCLKCHEGSVGDLLGAFTYRLKPT